MLKKINWVQVLFDVIKLVVGALAGAGATTL